MDVRVDQPGGDRQSPGVEGPNVGGSRAEVRDAPVDDVDRRPVDRISARAIDDPRSDDPVVRAHKTAAVVSFDMFSVLSGQCVRAS
ncbi:hypothetical protein ACIBJC_38445 [Streptomyces sp. NPDC050509]|uniref:hypothetical protein n=1 Tax=Streptomyces sp. NPDC050509 TaxID=3365620 RepID=UPI0037A2C40C